MTVRSLNKREAIDFVTAHAETIDAQANPTNPFASSVWLRHFIEQVARDDWTIVAPTSEVDGLMLLYHVAGRPDRCQALSNYYASLFSPVWSTAPDRCAAVSALVRQLSDRRPRLASVDLAPLDIEAEDTKFLLAALSSQGWYVKRYLCFGNWTLPCAGLGFEAYMASRDSQLRNTWTRKSKKLLAAGQLRIFTEAADVDAAMDAYEAVYAKSWKKPEPYPEFLRGWARHCADRGWLRLGVASIDGAPIAVQFWFTVAKRAYIFKLAYDEEQSKWSAGTVLTAEMFKHALDVDRVVEIDYLTGDDEYKKSWMSTRRQRIGLIACNLRSAAGLATAARELTGQLVADMRSRRAAARVAA
jgi:hypothetical protein